MIEGHFMHSSVAINEVVVVKVITPFKRSAGLEKLTVTGYFHSKLRTLCGLVRTPGERVNVISDLPLLPARLLVKRV